jgi:hypothetical protein
MTKTTVTADDIEAAERLLGIAYTTAERQLMVSNLEEQIGAAVARRSVRLANSAPPASRFDPRLPTFYMPAAGSLHFTNPATSPARCFTTAGT